MHGKTDKLVEQNSGKSTPLTSTHTHIPLVDVALVQLQIRVGFQFCALPLHVARRLLHSGAQQQPHRG